MKPSDTTQYVFDATIGLFLLFGLVTADAMRLFGDSKSLSFHLNQVGLSEVAAVVVTFVAYLAVYSVVSRIFWKVLLGIVAWTFQRKRF